MKFSVCMGATRPSTLKAAIDSIRRQSWQDWELLIVGQENDLKLQSLGELVSQQDSKIKYFHLDQPGLTRARNFAIKVAAGDIIALTDDDCEAREDWLTTLAEYFQNDLESGIVGGATLAPKPAKSGPAVCPTLTPLEKEYNSLAEDHQPFNSWLWGCANVALRREVIEKLGPFDEYLGAGATFPAADDLDYMLRAEAKGIKMRTTPRAVVYHTYGYRYGWRAVVKHKRNYALGNGGFAGKLTLLGDPRGRLWLSMTWKSCTVDKLLKGKLWQLPTSLIGLRYYVRAYKQCLSNYYIEAGQSLLCKISS